MPAQTTCTIITLSSVPLVQVNIQWVAQIQDTVVYGYVVCKKVILRVQMG